MSPSEWLFVIIIQIIGYVGFVAITYQTFTNPEKTEMEKVITALLLPLSMAFNVMIPLFRVRNAYRAFLVFICFWITLVVCVFLYFSTNNIILTIVGTILAFLYVAGECHREWLAA